MHFKFVQRTRIMKAFEISVGRMYLYVCIHIVHRYIVIGKYIICTYTMGADRNTNEDVLRHVEIKVHYTIVKKMAGTSMTEHIC